MLPLYHVDATTVTSIWKGFQRDKDHGHLSKANYTAAFQQYINVVNRVYQCIYLLSAESGSASL